MYTYSGNGWAWFFHCHFFYYNYYCFITWLKMRPCITINAIISKPLRSTIWYLVIRVIFYRQFLSFFLSESPIDIIIRVYRSTRQCRKEKGNIASVELIKWIYFISKHCMLIEPWIDNVFNRFCSPFIEGGESSNGSLRKVWANVG